MKKVVTRANANIALIKYWGKKDEEKRVPFNSSISMTLDNLYTITTIEQSNDGFRFTLDEVEASPKEADKVLSFLRHFASSEQLNCVRVSSINSFPTSAGLASSASGFAALAVAANQFFETHFEESKLSQITRMGSGSACRSLYSGFVAWEKEGNVYEIKSTIQEFAMIVVILDSNQKKQSSREAMSLTVATSLLYPAWVNQANFDFLAMKDALVAGDEETIGKLTEQSSILMHQTMQNASPSINYQTKESLQVLELVKELRSQGIYAYATMDAGPNVKILTKEKDLNKILKSLEACGIFDAVVCKTGKKADVLYVER